MAKSNTNTNKYRAYKAQLKRPGPTAYSLGSVVGPVRPPSQIQRSLDPSSLLGIPRARDILPSRPDLLGLPRGLPTGFTRADFMPRYRGTALEKSRLRAQAMIRGTPVRIRPPNEYNFRRLQTLAQGGSLEKPPPMPRTKSNPCERRQKRKQVLFSLGIPGSKWARRLINMTRARHTLYSQYSCR